MWRPKKYPAFHGVHIYNRCFTVVGWVYEIVFVVQIHGVLELVFLSLLGCDLVIRFIWFGARHFIKQRTALLVSWPHFKTE